MKPDQSVPVRALLIDLDGVIRLWTDDDSKLEFSHGLAIGVLRKTAFEPALLRRAITGQISDEVRRQEVFRQLQQNHPSSRAHEAVEAWSAAVGVINHPVLDVVRRARNCVKLVLVTNATSRLDTDLKALGLASEFDAIVNSSVVGTAKPDEQIYRVALKNVGVLPAEAVFVDDSRANTEAARRLGLCALDFEDHKGLEQFLGGNHVFRKDG